MSELEPDSPEVERSMFDIMQYNMKKNLNLHQQEKQKLHLERLENKLQSNSFSLQMIVGFGFSCIAIFILWDSSNYGLSAQLATGIFFGIMAQVELAEILFSGKSEKSSVEHQIKDIDLIIEQGKQGVETVQVQSGLESLSLKKVSAKIPETPILIEEISLEIRKGDWIALYGETGKGKTTFLNSLFYPEYRRSGTLRWNGDGEISHLPVPESVYVTQKAYLLTGTLRENFEGYPGDEIEQALKTVDLTSWYLSLPKGLDSWLGENGETLSGGQRKKLLLAQALLKKPQLLVVDEPTAGLSSENAIAIFRSIKHEYPDITILMATHLRDFVSEVDRVVSI